MSFAYRFSTVGVFILLTGVLIGCVGVGTRAPVHTQLIAPTATASRIMYIATSTDLRPCPRVSDGCPVSIRAGVGVPVEIISAIDGDTVDGSSIWYEIRIRNEVLFVHGAARLSETMQVNLPMNLPTQLLNQAYQSILNQIEVKSVPAIDYELFQATLESVRCRSEFRTKGKINAARLPNMSYAVNINPINQRWEFIENTPSER